MKKTKKIWISSLLALVVAAALSAGVVTQLVRPVSVKQVCVSIEPLHVGTFPGEKSLYNQYKNESDGGAQVFLEENAFPSDQPEDYCFVWIYPVYQSRSALHTNLGEGFINNPEQATGAIYKSPIFMSTVMPRFSAYLCEDAFTLVLQRNGRSDEEIIQMVQGLDMDVFFENDLLHSKKMKLPLKKAKLVSGDEIRKLADQYGDN